MRALTVVGAPRGTVMGYIDVLRASIPDCGVQHPPGAWISNPKTNSSERFVFWPIYMLREALSATNERTRLVNVSDGGHTGDNVGIPRPRKRAAKIIIASDAEADPTTCLWLVHRGAAACLRRSRRGRRYRSVDDHSGSGDHEQGALRDRPNPVSRMSGPSEFSHLYEELADRQRAGAGLELQAATSAAFPHESTADQFFDDTQFESYRALGDHIAEDVRALVLDEQSIRSSTCALHRSAKSAVHD